MKSLERAVFFLESLLSEEGQDWMITELVERTGLSLSTTHRMLSAWQKLGFVQQDPVTRRYRLGMKLMELGMALWRQLDIRVVAHPVMVTLSREVGQSTFLTVREALDGVIVGLVEGSSHLRLIPPVGLRLPLHMGGSRRVLTAYLPEDEREEVIRLLGAAGKKAAPTAAWLRESLAHIRERGYEISVGETQAGTTGVAVPVWGADGRVAAGLMVGGPDVDFGPTTIDRIIQATVRAGREISGLLGYSKRSAS